MLETRYIFFADIYFIQNFIIKATVLFLTVMALKIPMIKPVIKVLVVAAIGTLLEIMGLFFSPNYELFLAMTHLVQVPGMLLFLLIKHRELIGKGIICGYFFVLVVNGVIEFLWNLIGNGWLYPLLVLIGALVSVVVTMYGIRRLRMKKGIYSVDIHCPDIIWTIKGYYDSGNRLRDPYTGKGVHIISKKLAERLELKTEKKVCIPYQSLGNSEGLIDVYYVERIEIKGESAKVKQQNTPLAVAEAQLFQGKGYEMIINEDVW